MKVPSLSDFTSSTEFIRALLLENKSANDKLGVRYFARKLNWSPSYLSALVKGKRQLSSRRVLELADFLAMDERDLGQLFLISFPQAKKPNARSALQKKPPTIKPHEKIATNVDYFAIFEYISSFEYLPTAQEIKQNMPIFKGYSINVIDQMIMTLIQCFAIQLDTTGRLLKVPGLESRGLPLNSSTRLILSQYLSQASKLTESSDTMGFQAGYAWMDEKTYVQFKRQLDSLVEWLQKNTAAKNLSRSKRSLYQIVAAIHPVSSEVHQ